MHLNIDDIKKRLGFIKQPDDERDKQFKPRLSKTVKLPSLIDLRKHCPPIFDQGELSSCTANAIAFAHLFDQLKQKKKNAFTPSRLFIYYNEREMENSVSEDSGAIIRDGFKSINTQGVCDEKLWSYDITKFADKPSPDCYSAALSSESIKYESVAQDLNHFKACLYSGYPFVFGFKVYESFESQATAKTGRVKMPAASENLAGGHAVVACGSHDKSKTVFCANSWSTLWGDRGFFYLPFDYILNPDLASDFWTVTMVK